MNLLRPILDPLLKRFFPPVEPLPAGVYHYQAPPDAPFPYRLHLRIEPDGRGVLIVNASTVVHLNNTAAEYVYHLVNQTPAEQAIAAIARRYNVNRETVRQDYHNLTGRLRALVEVPDLDPVTYLDFDRSDPYTGALSAPYRLDCALTYRLPAEDPRGLTPTERVKRELTTEEWKTVLDKAWNAGIPHVIFTGGEPTLRPDLPALIIHAESRGMVAGLITNGRALAEASYRQELLQAGLDHVMLVLDPDDDQAMRALQDTLAEDIAVVVHLTLTARRRDHFAQIIDRLAALDVQNISLSADSADLKEELAAHRQAVADRQMRLFWDLPVPYSHFNPVTLEIEQSPEPQPGGPGRAWLYVEPDGDVLPGQGYNQAVLGNLLTDTWETIWQNARAWQEKE